MHALRLLSIFFALAVSAFARPLVVIDAGHGGQDRGGMPGQAIPEKGYALDVAKRLESTLRSAGYSTVMTRSSDVFISLDQRVAIANQYRNAIFVSIHFNGAANFAASGIETYYYSGRESAALAASIHRSVVGATGSPDRRVRTRSLHVIRLTKMPAVLCELGFLTNCDEYRRIDTRSYRQRLAEAVSRGIAGRYR